MVTLKIREVRTGSVITTDGVTAQVIASFNTATGGPNGTPLENCSIFITARCSGFCDTDNTAAGEWIGACFKVTDGTLQQVGGTNHAIAMIKDTGGAPNSDCGNALSSIIYFVTGVAGKTIEWFGGMEIYICQPT